jgi:prolyl-tRNA synthetase
MRDGKALQMATSHELGQNFAKAFDIKFQDESGTAAYCYTTSWGASTRLIGGLIMSHGDDNGLVVPPRLAPIQAVVLAVRDEESVNNAAEEISRQLLAAGIRVRTDHGRGSFGRRVTDWEIKGVPVRVEVGPRDLAEGLVTLARRDTGEKIQVRLEEAPARIVTLLEEIQQSILESSRSALVSRTVDVSSIAEAAEVANEGFARLGWDLVQGEGEATLRTQAITVRCLQRADGSMPDNEDEAGLVAIVAKSY